MHYAVDHVVEVDDGGQLIIAQNEGVLDELNFVVLLRVLLLVNRGHRGVGGKHDGLADGPDDLRNLRIVPILRRVAPSASLFRVAHVPSDAPPRPSFPRPPAQAGWFAAPGCCSRFPVAFPSSFRLSVRQPGRFCAHLAWESHA